MTRTVNTGMSSAVLLFIYIIINGIDYKFCILVNRSKTKVFWNPGKYGSRSLSEMFKRLLSKMNNRRTTELPQLMREKMRGVCFMWCLQCLCMHVPLSDMQSKALMFLFSLCIALIIHLSLHSSPHPPPLRVSDKHTSETRHMHQQWILPRHIVINLLTVGGPGVMYVY